jgi:hypothetical protein
LKAQCEDKECKKLLSHARTALSQYHREDNESREEVLYQYYRSAKQEQLQENQSPRRDTLKAQCEDKECKKLLSHARTALSQYHREDNESREEVLYGGLKQSARRIQRPKSE